MGNNPTGKGGFAERPQAINRKGKPKSFDQLRALAQKLSHELLTGKDGNSLTVAEAILRKLAQENPEHFLEIAYGKVPNQTDITSGGKPFNFVIEIEKDDADDRSASEI